MAAPGVTARITPTGFKMPDGYQTTYAFALNPAVQVWEQIVTPASQDGGEAIDTTTMFSAKYRTKDHQSLVDIMDAEVEAMYDPIMWIELLNMLNITQAITEHYPNHATLAYWGFLRKVQKMPMEIGKPPKCKLTITVSNWDPINFVEAGPVFTDSSGTP